MPITSKSLTTTKGKRKVTKRDRPPIHPGEMLREEFMVPLGLSSNALAIAIRVPATRINEIVKERRGITADTALRLGQYFRMTPEFWMGLQSHYDLECAREEDQDSIERDITPAPVDSKTGSLRSLAA